MLRTEINIRDLSQEPEICRKLNLLNLNISSTERTSQESSITQTACKNLPYANFREVKNLHPNSLFRSFGKIEAKCVQIRD